VIEVTKIGPHLIGKANALHSAYLRKSAPSDCDRGGRVSSWLIGSFFHVESLAQSPLLCPMVRVSGQKLLRAIDLLGQHGAGQQVGPGHGAK
jgi:hypothetical protein